MNHDILKRLEKLEARKAKLPVKALFEVKGQIVEMTAREGVKAGGDFLKVTDGGSINDIWLILDTMYNSTLNE